MYLSLNFLLKMLNDKKPSSVKTNRKCLKLDSKEPICPGEEAQLAKSLNKSGFL